MQVTRLGPLNGRARGVQWACLLALSVIFTLLAQFLRLPAALLLGPMFAGMLVGIAEGTIRVSRYPFVAAQGVIGCMIGRSIPLSIIDDLAHGWPLFVAGVVSVIAAGSTLGWLMTRWRLLPGTTAIWGTSPGASTPMILMSEAYGADMRLVAIMHQLRVVSVALTASIVATLWAAKTVHAPDPLVWFPAVPWGSFLGTIAVAAGGALTAMFAGIPAGALLLPLAVGMTLQEMGWMTIELPPWLLAISYALVAWNIGLRFTRPIIRYAMGALPQMVGSIFALIAICGVIAAGLVAAGVDPLTAYLATCPGGADSVAIITASTSADLRFVMTMQAARLIVALFTSPAISRFIAVRSGL